MVVRVVGVAGAPAVLLVAVVIVVATKERCKGRKGGEDVGIGKGFSGNGS